MKSGQPSEIGVKLLQARSNQPGKLANDCLFVVRAKVEEASREKFGQWYESEHLFVALRDTPAVSAMLGQCDAELGVHLAFYEFSDLVSASTHLSCDLMKEFTKEFDKHWAGKVIRTREVFEAQQLLKKG